MVGEPDRSVAVPLHCLPFAPLPIPRPTFPRIPYFLPPSLHPPPPPPSAPLSLYIQTDMLSGCLLPRDRVCSGLKGITGNLLIFFLFLALLELVIKLYTFGPRQYVRSAFNVLDVAAFVCAAIGLGVPAFNCVVMLRLLHILRVFSKDTRTQNIFHGTAKVWCLLHRAIPWDVWIAL